jgi:hypothetical protein
VLVHQTGGHVVLYHDGQPLWCTGILDATSEVLRMQSAGTLVEYAPDGRALWHTTTPERPNTTPTRPSRAIVPGGTVARVRFLGSAR